MVAVICHPYRWHISDYLPPPLEFCKDLVWILAKIRQTNKGHGLESLEATPGDVWQGQWHWGWGWGKGSGHDIQLAAGEYKKKAKEA